MSLKYEEITAYLSSIGASDKEIRNQPQKLKALQALAEKYGGDLHNAEAVRAAASAKTDAATRNQLAKRTAKIRALTADQKRRYRRAFNHYDADSSGELDMEEFRIAAR